MSRSAPRAAAKDASSQEALLFPHADAELAGLARGWFEHLGGERRVSALTLEAYVRDLRQFLAFAAVHFGATPTVAAVCSLSPADCAPFWRRGGTRAWQPLAAAPARGAPLFCALP